MGDLRNKFAKMAVTQRIQAMQRRLEASQPLPEPPRCQCGQTYHQVEVMWAVPADRWSLMQFYCRCARPNG